MSNNGLKAPLQAPQKEEAYIAKTKFLEKSYFIVNYLIS